MPGLGGILRKSKKDAKEPEVKTETGKIFLKAVPLRDLADLETVKADVKSGNILILRITPLAGKSIDEVKQAVNELTEFAESSGGDIARLGEERVVICPPHVKIWREKPPVSSEPIPTTA